MKTIRVPVTVQLTIYDQSDRVFASLHEQVGHFADDAPIQRVSVSLTQPMTYFLFGPEPSRNGTLYGEVNVIGALTDIVNNWENIDAADHLGMPSAAHLVALYRTATDYLTPMEPDVSIGDAVNPDDFDAFVHQWRRCQQDIVGQSGDVPQ